jgi:hypothetical protein
MSAYTSAFYKRTKWHTFRNLYWQSLASKTRLVREVSWREELIPQALLLFEFRLDTRAWICLSETENLGHAGALLKAVLLFWNELHTCCLGCVKKQPRSSRVWNRADLKYWQKSMNFSSLAVNHSLSRLMETFLGSIPGCWMLSFGARVSNLILVAP